MGTSAILLPPHWTNLTESQWLFPWSRAKTLIIIPSPSTARKVFLHALASPLSLMLILLQVSVSWYGIIAKKCAAGTVCKGSSTCHMSEPSHTRIQENSSFGAIVSPSVPQIYPTSENLCSAISWKWKYFILNKYGNFPHFCRNLTFQSCISWARHLLENCTFHLTLTVQEISLNILSEGPLTSPL